MFGQSEISISHRDLQDSASDKDLQKYFHRDLQLFAVYFHQAWGDWDVDGHGCTTLIICTSTSVVGQQGTHHCKVDDGQQSRTFNHYVQGRSTTIQQSLSCTQIRESSQVLAWALQTYDKMAKRQRYQGANFVSVGKVWGEFPKPGQLFAVTNPYSKFMYLE